MSVIYLSGTDAQNRIIQEGLDKCDFPFDRLLPSLQAEGRSTVRVEWKDLSRYNHSAAAHDHASGAHTISREVDGRSRVLGLFYLPPHTSIVLDKSLETMPELAQEVALAEVAHLVDYHFMTPEHRRAVVNALHTDQLGHGADVSDGVAFTLDGHVCSWFDVNEYAWWVGEAFMEAFIEAFAPSIPVTIQLNHPVDLLDAATIRSSILGVPVEKPKNPEPVPVDAAPDSGVADQVMVDAVRRLVQTRSVPKYFAKAATLWLQTK